MVKACLCLPVCELKEGDNESGEGGGTLMTLKDDLRPFKKVKRQIRTGGGITNRPPHPILITSDAHPPGIWDCVSPKNQNVLRDMQSMFLQETKTNSDNRGVALGH